MGRRSLGGFLMADTDWVQVGATVAEYDHRYRMNPRVAFVTVERITPAQIVCVNGNRYRRDNGTRVGERGVEIRPVDDREVRGVVAKRTAERLCFDVDRMRLAMGRGETDALALLDQVEAAVAAARAMIDDPVGSGWTSY